MNEAKICFHPIEWRQLVMLASFMGIFIAHLFLYLVCLVPGATCQVFVNQAYFVLLLYSFACLQLSSEWNLLLGPLLTFPSFTHFSSSFSYFFSWQIKLPSLLLYHIFLNSCLPNPISILVKNRIKFMA